jgi:hypothetical protein
MFAGVEQKLTRCALHAFTFVYCLRDQQGGTKGHRRLNFNYKTESAHFPSKITKHWGEQSFLSTLVFHQELKMRLSEFICLKKIWRLSEFNFRLCFPAVSLFAVSRKEKESAGSW